MRVLNGIYIHEPNNHLAAGHIALMDAFAKQDPRVAIRHILYYAIGSAPLQQFPHFVCGVRDGYMEMPSKTFCMFEHALTLPDWDYFVKTDVNAVVSVIEWEEMFKRDYSGSYNGPKDDGTPSCGCQCDRPYKGFDPAYAKARPTHPLPLEWCSTCYAVSRKAAAYITENGFFYSRTFNSEDLMVSTLMAAKGLIPVRTITTTAD